MIRFISRRMNLLKQIEELPWKFTLHGFFCRMSWELFSIIILFYLFIYLFIFYTITWTKRSVHGFGIELKKNEDFGNFAWESAFTIRQAKHHVYVKRQRRICTTWPSFLFPCRLLFIISTQISSFMQVIIHKNCFDLFLSAHFSSWEILNLNLTFVVCVKLKLSTCANI